MQRTRLNGLLDNSIQRLTQFFNNPWRRISLILLSFFTGFFVGGAISTTFGQKGQVDIVMAVFILVFTELTSQWVYRRPLNPSSSSLWWNVLNLFKIGVVYSLYLEAFKLGS